MSGKFELECHRYETDAYLRINCIHLSKQDEIHLKIRQIIVQYITYVCEKFGVD